MGKLILIILLFFAPIAIVCISCGVDKNNGRAEKDSGTRDFLVGIAPIPRNFPGSREDWIDALENIKYSGDIVTAQSPWRDSPEVSGDTPEFIKLLGGQKDNYGYEVLYGINFFEQKGDYLPILWTTSNSVNDWTNQEARYLYRNTALSICSVYRPKYLSLALEVNSYYLRHQEDFRRFMDFYVSLYDEIKSYYPDMKVFVTFQLEMMKGLGGKTWGLDVNPHWSLLDDFGDKIDLIVFTSYPEVEFASPDEIPDDYYDEISERTSKKVAFSEIGWSSSKYTEADQSRFIKRFKVLTEKIDMEFANWIFMHDLPYDGPLTKTGLRYSDGRVKDAWYKWKALKDLKYRK